jgi:N12 class adenine-specific DNA methylase
MPPPVAMPIAPQEVISAGEKAKARDILVAVKTLKTIERDHRPATDAERAVLARFGGFGAVALSIFPDPVKGQYKDDAWKDLGHQLRSILTDREYDSAKRTTFNAFYTSPTVIHAIHSAMDRFGVRSDATVLEPGCGSGNFIRYAPAGYRFIGVELDDLSGRIARALHPGHDIRIEDFSDVKLPQDTIDAVVGNVPFADLKLPYSGMRLALHDYFFAKSINALRAGGVMGLVTSRYTLDKQNAQLRGYLADKADFLGAIRLPSDAFKREGTAVVTDILFFRKREKDAPVHHIDDDWIETGTLEVEGAAITLNRYFIKHPKMVLGTLTRQDTMYGKEGFSVKGGGDLDEQLKTAIKLLPDLRTRSAAAPTPTPEQPRAPDSYLTFDAADPSDSLPPRLNEGSFFIAGDRGIRQIQEGKAVPVVYGGTALTAYGSLLGKRLAALIDLRDRARAVLVSQNEDQSKDQRDAARRELNRVYDRFVLSYGPVNKTTFSESSDGSITRRMPNLVKFRDDPDAMLVMSLEEYDETTGKAAKAPILLHDVVGKREPLTAVRSAEEGLLASLNDRGVVDVGLISRLYGKDVPAVIAELGDLIYLDPVGQTGEKTWQTSDAYLSGNVRQKLAQAREAGPDFSRNAAALEAVQPEDVLPGEIDANLGAPWIPASDIQAFAADLFRVAPESIPISHLVKDAAWAVAADYAAKSSVAATSELGTARANGTWLFELALNMKSPTIYDQLDDDTRVVNPQETLSAREKQKVIKERFKAWVFAEPDRSERLVRVYNDTYNNLRHRLFDGSHLDFAGMNPALTLRPHQKDAVWRIMSGGNTLLAHVVGAGKTFTMAAAGMKLKQAGLVHKPMFVVPNHLLEQFAREFMQLYPNSHLLIAAKEDLTRERRKFLTARIASGQWDGIIVTHSGFERIGMSRDYQERFLREQIDEYNRLLIEHARDANRNLIKTIEKQKAARQLRLKQLLAAEKKDDGLVFDELGVDHLFIDEAHYFKNLETPTKMDRVAGIQTGGSERAFDLYMKARYLHQRHPGHGVTFATGTPISNTMVEMYTMQRFLDPAGLTSRSIEHFDAWAATFGEVVETMEISPDGAGLRPRSRFARFVNLPELQQMFRSFSDVQTANMLNLPRPKLAGCKPVVVTCPMSDQQRALQEQLVARYERIRNGGVDPSEDNALAITTDGRKLATDPRMLIDAAEDFSESKVNKLVENVAGIYRDSASNRGTQMIFSDMGVNPTAWGYSVYQEVVDKLVQAGIPRNEIAAIGDAATDAKKQALFERVRNGSIRVLIGSTAKMGTGTNVQKRLIALHHLDAPWKPAEVEQRDGRILRQGNLNPEVQIYRYVTQGSFDAYMWQALETKAKFIGQVITGDNTKRAAEDVGDQELSYAEVKAIASGNPAVLTLAQAEAELGRLALLKKNHLDEQFVARRSVKNLPEVIAAQKQHLADLTADQQTVASHPVDSVTIDDRTYHGGDAIAALGARLEQLPRHVNSTLRVPLGSFRGVGFGMVLRSGFPPDAYLQGKATLSTLFAAQHPGPRAMMNALHRLAGEYAQEADSVRQRLAIADGQLRDYTARLDTPFAHTKYIAELKELRDQLKQALSAGTQSSASAQPSAVPTTGELVDRIRLLQASNQIEPAAQRDRTVRAEVEESIVARIRRRRESSQTTTPQVGEDVMADVTSELPAGASVQPVPPSFARRIATTSMLGLSEGKGFKK